MKRIWLILTAVIVGQALVVAGPARAATTAFDSAASGAYDNGWQTGDNGGTGFLAWSSVSAGVDAGAEISTSVKPTSRRRWEQDGLGACTHDTTPPHIRPPCADSMGR